MRVREEFSEVAELKVHLLSDVVRNPGVEPPPRRRVVRDSTHHVVGGRIWSSEQSSIALSWRPIASA